MQIGHCEFPEDVFYDVEELAWARPTGDNKLVLGITSIMASVAGRLESFKLKPAGTKIEIRKSVGTYESLRFFGVVRSPVAGTIAEINKSLVSRPKRLSPNSFR